MSRFLILILILCSWSVTVFSVEKNRSATNKIPNPLAEYISAISRNTTFLNIPHLKDENCPETITRTQALADARLLKYCFETAYSGYDYWSRHGMDFDALYRTLRDYIMKNETVSVQKMELIIADSLKTINDGHLSVCGRQYHGFYTHKESFFADILIEKQQDRYIVIDSSDSTVKPGFQYTGNSEFLFPTLAPEGKEHFLLGVFSYSYTFSHMFSFNMHEYEIMLHRCRMTAAQNSDLIFSEYLQNSVPVVSVQSFLTAHNAELILFSESGKLHKNDRFLILNITGNRGGSSRYSRDFFYNLNNAASWETYYAELISPAIIQSWADTQCTEKTPEYIKQCVKNAKQSENELRKNPVVCWSNIQHVPAAVSGDFKGKLVLIMDRQVMSSGEACVAYTKSVPGSVIVGENSAGVGTFGEVRDYCLPHSKIWLKIPSKIFLSDELTEGIGYIPDYWIDSENPVSEVAKWLENPQHYTFRVRPPATVKNINFEEWNDDVPIELKKSAGIELPGSESILEKDTAIFYEGHASMKLSGNLQTPRWWFVYTEIPYGFSKITADFYVKGDNIHQEQNQYNNCYAGFIYVDGNGKKRFKSKNFDKTFDWKKETVFLDIKSEKASSIRFAVFLSKSGTLWIDDVKFTTEK